MRRHSPHPRRDASPPPSDVVFGINPVLEALRASSVARLYYAPDSHGAARVVVDAQAHGIAIEAADREQLARMSGGGNHQGVVARTRPFAFVPFEDLLGARPPMLVVLDGILDPQNLGAIMRSAEVLGAGGVVLPKDRSVGVTPAVVRASSGAAAHLRVARVVNLVRALDEVKKAGYWVVGLDGAGRTQFRDLPSFEQVALVVGGEGVGMRPLVARACDFTVGIPVRGQVQSLNAAAAAAIGLHEVAKRLDRST